MNRRNALKLMTAAAAAPGLAPAKSEAFAIRYVLSSAMYGDLPLDDVLPEVAKTGAESIDIWRLRHANHREQISEMGDEVFRKKLLNHKTKMSISTCYRLDHSDRMMRCAGWRRMGAT